MLSLSGYWLLTHKIGEKLSNCQDFIEVDGKLGFGAIADGATESFESGRWAKCLVKEYLALKYQGPYSEKVWLDRARRRWESEIKDRIAQGQANEYLVNRFTNRDEAYSTFVGFTISQIPGNPRRLKVDVEGIGDSCLIRFSGQSCTSFPLENSTAFTDRPEALSSRARPDGQSLKPWSFEIGENDTLVLATDAFAKFLLQGLETRGPWIAEFFSIRTKPAIEALIQRYRETKNLQNDDIALAFLTCKPSKLAIEDFTFETRPTESSPESAGSGRALVAANVFSPAINPEVRPVPPDVNLSHGVRTAGGNAMNRQVSPNNDAYNKALQEQLALAAEEYESRVKGKLLPVWGLITFLSILSVCMIFGLAYQYIQIGNLQKQVEGIPDQASLVEEMHQQLYTLQTRPVKVEPPIQYLVPQPPPPQPYPQPKPPTPPRPPAPKPGPKPKLQKKNPDDPGANPQPAVDPAPAQLAPTAAEPGEKGATQPVNPKENGLLKKPPTAPAAKPATPPPPGAAAPTFKTVPPLGGQEPQKPPPPTNPGPKL